MTKMLSVATLTVMCALSAMPAVAQQRPPSPDAHAATQVGGHYIGADPLYVDGKWIEISYGGPIKRSRDLWGSGATYGRMLMNGAPVWRAGADISTYLMTETTLVINGKTIAPGGYTMFIDLKPGKWTLIVSNWEPQKQFNPGDRTRLWGSFGYTPDKDVARVAMKIDKFPLAVDELTWNFADVTPTGGKLVLQWDTVVASAPFTVTN